MGTQMNISLRPDSAPQEGLEALSPEHVRIGSCGVDQDHGLIYSPFLED